MSLWLASLAGCADGGEAGPSGKYVEFFLSEPTQELCAGTIARLDQYIERVADFLGMPLPSGFKVPIYTRKHPSCPNACYLPEEDAVYLDGLERGGTVVPDASLRHELAHAVFERLLGHGSPFLNEGLAEALNSTVRVAPAPGAPVGDMLEKPAADVDYAEAAHFVRFLIDTRGLERFKQLYQTVRAGDSRATIVTRFAEVYGERFVDIEDEYTAGPRRCGFQVDVCDGPEVEPVGTRWSVVLAASCQDPEFFGADGGVFGAQRLVDLEFSGRYRLLTKLSTVSNSAGRPVLSIVKMIRCGDCEEQFTQTIYSEEIEYNLAAGRYVFVFLPAADSVMKLDVEYIDG